MEYKIPIFYYHSVGNAGPETLALEVFREHLFWLKKLGFTTITVSQLVRHQFQRGQNYAVLTFDDGLLDNYENALPILLELGCRATFFVIPGFDQTVRWVNPATRQWSDNERQGFTIPFPSMQGHHRAELVALGMEIGSHTMTHPELTKVSKEMAETEIFKSKRVLEEQLGIEVTSFCFPKGRFNRTTIEHVKRAGYNAACTTIPGYCSSATDPFECGRFLVEESATFAKILQWSMRQSTPADLLFRALNKPLKLKNRFL